MYITTVVTLSRPEMVELAIEQLPKILSLKHQHELVIGIDNAKILQFSVKNLLEKHGIYTLCRNITIIETRRRPASKFNMPERRTRIADMHNRIKGEVGGSDFVFGYEDDTLLPDNCIEILIEDWKGITGVPIGFIEGVQVGRWGMPYIGAWTVDDPREPNEYTSIIPKKRLTEIDCGGFYCFLTLTDLYRNATFTWREPMGPDAAYGLSLKRAGYSNFIDRDVECGHRTSKETLYPTGDVVALKIYLNQEARTVHEIVGRKRG